MPRYIMYVIADDENVIVPKVCCDCRQAGIEKDGSIFCCLGGKYVPDNIDTEKPQNNLCPVIKSKKIGFLGRIILYIIKKWRGE